MKSTLFVAVRTTFVLLMLTGLAYPLLVTGLAQLFFATHANGSWVQDDRGQIVGSELIAQAFVSPSYFQPRPSAAGNGYDPSNSSGSNLGPTNAKLKARIGADLKRLVLENPDATSSVPAELLTTSGSGLDPHVSPDAIAWQLPRVAKARGLPVARIQTLVEQNIETRDLGVLGEPRVNVLMLNLAMDRQFGRLAQAENLR